MQHLDRIKQHCVEEKSDNGPVMRHERLKSRVNGKYEYGVLRTCASYPPNPQQSYHD